MNILTLNKLFKTYAIFSLFLLISCGSNNDIENETTLYKKKNIGQNKLE